MGQDSHSLSGPTLLFVPPSTCFTRAMTSFVSHTSVDCRDAYALSEFWRPILGYVDNPEDPNEPGHEECPIFDPETGHTLLFIEVPDPTPGKNKIHLDLRPRTGTETKRLNGSSGWAPRWLPTAARPTGWDG